MQEGPNSNFPKTNNQRMGGGGRVPLLLTIFSFKNITSLGDHSFVANLASKKLTVRGVQQNYQKTNNVVRATRGKFVVYTDQRIFGRLGGNCQLSQKAARLSYNTRWQQSCDRIPIIHRRLSTSCEAHRCAN